MAHHSCIGSKPRAGVPHPDERFRICPCYHVRLQRVGGYEADGVSVVRCRNFSFRKFKNALAELLLYLIISETIYSILLNCGDDTAALIAMKSLTYVFMYVYVQNAFRNLIHAYPTNKALRIIYHVIRFEFKRALPENVQRIVERVEREHGEEINEEFTDKNKEEEK